MKRLPYLQYDAQTARRETVAFLGLNRSDQTQEGELSACENLSDRRFPYLSPRGPRSYEEYTSPTAAFAWNGKTVLVDGTDLYYDGEKIGTVTAGEKQFAVVNTKLCIFPDAVYIDLENETFRSLNATAVAAPNSATFSSNGISLSIATSAGNEKAEYSTMRVRFSDSKEEDFLFLKGYSAAKWTGSQWELSGENEHMVCGYDTSDVENVPAKGRPREGEFILFSQTPGDGSTSSVDYSSSEYKPNTSYLYRYDEDKDGTWDDVTEEDYGPPLDRYFGVISSYTDEYINEGGGFRSHEAVLSYQVFDGATANDDLTNYFQVGDRVQIRGCITHPANNTKAGTYLTVSSVTEDTIAFSNAEFEAGEANDEAGQVVITRAVPSMDYICEKDNRLWGVSSKDKTIYASALGDPTNFYAFDGLDTDSYSVAVGSEGNFTGLCKYGNTVLAWKERTLHKILGNYPSDFQMATYQYAGVMDGSYKSLVNINEILFYLGRDGVFAYSGGAPELISYKLGDWDYRDGVGGTDGLRYFLSAADKTGVWALFSYSTQSGLWFREDGLQAVDFCRVDEGTRFLSGNRLYTMNSGDETVNWSAVFAPFYETIQGRKCVSRLFLRVEAPKGTYMTVFLRCDGKPWQKIGTITGGTADTRTMTVALNRCDKFEVKIEGHGACALLSMLREYRVGSER